MCSKIFNGLLFTLLCCSSCTKQDTNNTPVPVSRVEYVDKYLKLSEVYDKKYEVLTLDTPTPDAAIRFMSRIIFTDDRIFVFDRTLYKMFSFDRQGHFLGSTSKFIGRGNNEYIRMIDIAYDKKDKLIYAFCDSPYCYYILDKELNFVKKVNTDYYLTEITVDEDYVYGVKRTENYATMELVSIPKDNLSSEPKRLVSTKKNVKGLGGGNCLSGYNNQIFACLSFDNIIYKILDGQAQPVCSIDFGEKEADLKNNNMSARDFLNLNQDKEYVIQNIVVSDSTIIFQTTTPRYFLYNCKTNTCTSYRGFVNDVMPIPCTFILSSFGLHNEISYFISPEYIESYKKYAKLTDVEKMTDILYNLSENYSDNMNPIIIKWKIK